MERCPVCRARFRDEAVCYRCGADLSVLLAIEAEAAELEREAVTLLAAGQWIERGRLVHPVHEVTIAGNLKTMLLDVDAVGNDLVFRGSSASPTIRIRKMMISGR